MHHNSMQISCACAVINTKTFEIAGIMPLKSTAALTWNLIETVLCEKTWKGGMGVENSNFNDFKNDTDFLRSSS